MSLKSQSHMLYDFQKSIIEGMNNLLNHIALPINQVKLLEEFVVVDEGENQFFWKISIKRDQKIGGN